MTKIIDGPPVNNKVKLERNRWSTCIDGVPVTGIPVGPRTDIRECSFNV